MRGKITGQREAPTTNQSQQVTQEYNPSLNIMRATVARETVNQLPQSRDVAFVMVQVVFSPHATILERKQPFWSSAITLMFV
jgi:hypothetical protein